MIFMPLVLALILLDQWVKLWVVDHIPLYENLPFIPHLVDLTYIQNTGAAFSMLSGQTWFLSIISMVMSVVICYLLITKYFPHTFGQFSLALILAGAVGNLIDRVFRGYVVDMFELLFVRFAIFNVADICVVVGGIFACGYYLFVFPDESTEGDKNTESNNETQNSDDTNSNENTESNQEDLSETETNSNQITNSIETTETEEGGS